MTTTRTTTTTTTNTTPNTGTGGLSTSGGTVVTTEAPVFDVLLPYGMTTNDEQVQFDDANDGYSEITLPQQFRFGESRSNKLYINVNGFATFDEGTVAAVPSMVSGFRDLPIIAPFWSDIDLNDLQGLQNPGRVYYTCINRRTPFSRISSQDTADFNKVQREILENIDFTPFNPTMVCRITWSDVSPYPFDATTEREKNTFQLVLTSDMSNGKSFAIFSYGTNSWIQSRSNAQGFKMKDFNMLYYPTRYAQDFFTSTTSAAYNLNGLTGPRGRPGVWFYRTTFSVHATPDSFKCFQWYDQELLGGQSWLSVRRPSCPCTLWQVMIDPAYKFFTNDFFRSTVCFVTNFPTSPTSAQKCCYTNFTFQFWFWWWNPWFPWAVSDQLRTSFDFSSGSALRYHPDQFNSLYYNKDLLPKSWCCQRSTNCYLFYQIRPADNCWFYRPPFFGFLFGDPHIRTLDGYEYTFNGEGEFWMIQSTDSINMQGRMGRYIEQDGTLSNATVFTGFAFSDFTSSIKSSPVSVTLTQDRSSFIIKDNKDNDRITNWYYANQTGIFEDVKNVGVRRKNEDLELTFPSGTKVSITNQMKALGVTLSLPDSLRTGSLNGLYGVFDGNKNNDLSFPNRTSIPLSSSEREIFNLAQTWAITQSESFFWYNNSESASTFYKPDFTPSFFDESNYCRINRTVAEDSCRKDGIINRACLYDICTTAVASFALQTLNSSNTARNLEEDNKANDVARLNSTLSEAQFTVNETTTFGLSIDASVINSTGTWQMNLASNLTGAQLTCQDSKCLEWQFSYKPPNDQEFKLSFTAISTDNKSSTELHVLVRLCNCNGNGKCQWDNLMLPANITDNSTQSNIFKRVICDCSGSIFTGATCDQVVDYCESGVCQEYGGNCSILPENQLTSLYALTNGSTSNNPPFKGYHCDLNCPTGTLKDTLDHCNDINECNVSTPCNPSTETCRNTYGSFSCECNPGYAYYIGNSTCLDINECTLDQDNCQQLCTNTIGSFSCSCHPGYDYNPALNICNVTASLSCNVTAGCDFCYTNVSCACNGGFENVNDTCVDVDECAVGGAAICDATSTTCNNTIGGYNCYCKDGFKPKDNDDKSCTACTYPKFGPACNGIGSCPESNWTAVSGCNSCQNPGYGTPSCLSDKDECALNSTLCGSGSCNNTEGSYYCTCNPWFFYDTTSCKQLDACQYNLTRDQAASTCNGQGTCRGGLNASYPGAFWCDCIPGYNGNYCENDINECVTNNCLAANTDSCVDLINGFRCKCKNGFSGDRCHYTVVATTIDTTSITGGTAATAATGTTIAGGGTTASSNVTTTVTTPASNTTLTIQQQSIRVTAITLPIIFTSLSVTSIGVIFGAEIIQMLVGKS